MKRKSKSKGGGPGVGFRAFRHFSSLSLIAACFLGLAAQAVQLQWEQGEFLKSQGERRVLREVAVKPNRGRILDRNGEILAVSTPVDSVWAHPATFCADRAGWAGLAEILELEADAFGRQCEAATGSEFMYLRRHLPPAVAARVESLDLAGIHLQREYRRFYPTGPVAAHVVGFADIDERGQEGLERQFEPLLGGDEGRNRIVRDNRGRVIERVHRLQPVRHGEDLVSSIDIRIQHATRRALARSLSGFKAVGASAVVLDSRSGEVLAMVNLPDFNPNRRDRDNTAAYRNRAVTDLLEPGSTIKPFTVAMALASGEFTPETMVETSPGKYRIGGHVIEDVHDYGNLSVSRVIVKSSNIGAAKIAMSLPARELFDTLGEVGFGRATGIELPGERRGSLVDRQKWRPIEHATLSYGYGLSVTPLQLAQSYAVLANGGRLVPVTIRRRPAPVDGRQVLPERVARDVVGMMEGVVSTEGTARRAAVAHFRVAGKTGTSHKLIDGRYADKRYVSSFAGIAPVSDPRFVMVVVVDDPHSEQYYGGYVAAPVFSAVMAEVLRLYDISPDDPNLDAVQLAARWAEATQ